MDVRRTGDADHRDSVSVRPVQVLTRVRTVALIGVAALVLGWGLSWAKAEIQQGQEDVAALRAQLESHNIEPVVSAPGASGERGPQGDRGERGEQGEPGRDASVEQIAAAVEVFMRLNPPADQPDPDDPEAQQPEIQEAEVQDPEVDDPDPDGNPCPAGYAMEPDTLKGRDVLVCTRQ